MTPATPGAPPAGAPRWVVGLAALVLAGYTLAAWQSAGSFDAFQFSPHMDMTTSFLIARDCVEGRGCTMEIIPNGGISLLGIPPGAIANHLAALIYGATGSFRGVPVLCAVLLAITTALIFAAAARRTGVIAGLAAYALFMHEPQMTALYAQHQYIVLYHFMPVFAACAILFGMHYAQGGRPRYLYLTALAVSLAAQTHQTGAALLPSLAFLVLLSPSGTRPRRGVLAAGAFLGAFALASYASLYHSSPTTLLGALAALHHQYPLLFPLLALVLLAAGALGAVLTRRRETVIGLRAYADVLYVAIAALPALPILVSPTIAQRYVFPMVPALAVLLGIVVGAIVWQLAWPIPGLLASIWRRRAPVDDEAIAAQWQPLSVLALCALPWLVPLDVRAPRSPAVAREWPAATGAALAGSAAGNRDMLRGLGMYDLQPALADLAREAGVSYRAVFPRIRAPLGWQAEVLGTLGVFWPLGQPDRAPGADGDEEGAWLLLAAPAGFVVPPTARDWRVYRTAARYDIAVQRFDPYVRQDCVAWAPVGADIATETSWRCPRFQPPNAPITETAFKWRLMPQVDEFAYPRDMPPSTHALRLRYAVRVPEQGRARALVLPPNASAAFHLSFERVEGVPYRGALPGSLVLVDGSPEGGEGFVEVQVTPRDANRPMAAEFLAFPPPILEIDAADYPWLAPLLAISVPGHDRQEVVSPEPLPSLPDERAAPRQAALTALRDPSGRALTVADFFTPEPHLTPFSPSDPTAPFGYVIAVMTAFALLLAGGVAGVLRAKGHGVSA